MKYSKRDMDILAEVWDQSSDKSLSCPQCGHKMIILIIKLVF